MSEMRDAFEHLLLLLPLLCRGQQPRAEMFPFETVDGDFSDFIRSLVFVRR